MEQEEQKILETEINQDIDPIKRLKAAYRFALFSIALLSTLSCIYLVNETKNQEKNSHIINVSGRQRMLSQNITKNLVLLADTVSLETRAVILKQLFTNYRAWLNGHRALRYGDEAMQIPPLHLSKNIRIYFSALEPYRLHLAHACRAMLLHRKKPDLEKLFHNETRFLKIMDKITFEFDAEAKAQIIKLKQIVIFFSVLTLFTLLLEMLFIFKPIVRLVYKNISDFNRLNEQLKIAIRKKEENDVKLALEQRNSVKQMIVAEEAERKRIARDLHDGLGQLVLSLKMNLMKLGEEQLADVVCQSLYQRLMDTTNHIASEVRTISYNLMPATLSEFGLGDCIEQYIQETAHLSAARIQFIQNNPKNKRLEPFKEVLVYRVCQELLNNATKHADASEIVLQLLFHADSLTIMVEDNGKGFDFNHSTMNARGKDSGMGLRNIKTRLQSVGATFDIDTTRAFGTTTHIQIPYTT